MSVRSRSLPPLLIALAAAASCAPRARGSNAPPPSATPAPATALDAGTPPVSAGPGRAELVWIPGGTFTMGSSDGDASEAPPHPVTVHGYWLDKTEVTVAAYWKCVSAGACTEPRAAGASDAGAAGAPGEEREPGPCNAAVPGREEHPVNCVDWHQATAFCAWAGRRLPTEEEWEYAAAGGNEQRPYPWGGDEPGPTLLNACGYECTAEHPGWFDMFFAEDGWPATAPVGSFPKGANRWGALDLEGNVSEWTASAFRDTYAGSADAALRAERGSAWLSGNVASARVKDRGSAAPASRQVYRGFRCARD